MGEVLAVCVSAKKGRRKNDVGNAVFREGHGIDLPSLPIGHRFMLGADVLMEVTQIGKKGHTRCAIYTAAGDCVMPKEGIFARVLKGGSVRVGDAVINLYAIKE